MIKIIGLFIILFFIGCQESSEKNKVEDIYGCMDSDAMNYDINATISNDSCIFNGCTDPEAINYNPFATIDDGNCLTEDFIPDGYSYYWNDEFNEDTLNRKYWNIENWWPGAFNNELQSYTSEQSNITLQNGYLYIRAQKETPFNPSRPEYTSGRINTKSKVESIRILGD